MRRLATIALLLCGSAFGQGWSALSNTTITSVCPSSPGGTSDCRAVVGAWSSGAVDTKNNRLLVWGGGHTDYYGNEVYAITLSGTPAVSRLTNPSPTISSASCSAGVTASSDGAPVSLHSYNGLIYHPPTHTLYTFGGAPAPCGGPLSFDVYAFDLTTNTWSHPSHTGWAYDPSTGSNGSEGPQCAYDALTEDIYCVEGGVAALYRYRPRDNTMVRLSASVDIGIRTTPVIDPDRRLMVFVGRDGGFLGFRLHAIDISTGSSYTVQDWMSSSSGCSTALNVEYPGATYDSARGELSFYPGTGNTFYTFNPATRVCVPNTFSGGIPNPVSSTAGIFGRFAYVPGLNKYVVLNDGNANAYSLTLDPQASNGLGSSTVSCIDRDGDGYGTGTGCTGRDADDGDSAVQTGAQCVTKYSTLVGCLNHLGYNPTRIWYVSPSGNNTTCVSGGAPVGIGSPCLTAATPQANIAAGDMILYRTGTYSETSRITPSINGSAGSPIIYMAYPGESVLIDTTATSQSIADLVDRSFIVIDGIKMTHGLNNGCISAATGSYLAGSQTFKNVLIRHVEAYNCYWGMISQGYATLTIEDSSFHDNPTEHGLYVGAKGTIAATNGVFRRNLFYNNEVTGIQLNGDNRSAVLRGNISYGNRTANYSFENNVHDSFFLSNVSFAAGTSGGLVISNYNGFEGAGYTFCGPSGTSLCTCGPANTGSSCPGAQTGNVIENFTAYNTTTTSDGSSTTSTPAIFVGLQNRSSTCTTTACLASDLGSNTYRNIIVVNATDGSNHYAPILFRDDDKTYLSTSTFTNVAAYQSDSTHANGVFAYGVNGSFGFNTYTCATAATLFTTGSLTNCTNADPQFVAASPTYGTTPSSFNLRLSGTSPFKTSGTFSRAAYDSVGTSFSAAPSLGAFQFTGGIAPTITTSSPLTAGTQGVAYSYTIAATGDATITFSVTVGSLPTGLSLASNGAISGTPSGTGTSTFTVTATNGVSPDDSKSFSLTINAPSSTSTRILGGRIVGGRIK